MKKLRKKWLFKKRATITTICHKMTKRKTNQKKKRRKKKRKKKKKRRRKKRRKRKRKKKLNQKKLPLKKLKRLLKVIDPVTNTQLLTIASIKK